MTCFRFLCQRDGDWLKVTYRPLTTGLSLADLGGLMSLRPRDHLVKREQVMKMCHYPNYPTYHRGSQSSGEDVR